MSFKGFKHSEETKRKIKEALKGRKLTEKTIKKISDKIKKIYQNGRIPWNKTNLFIQCKVCGKIVKTVPCRKEGEHKFCSLKCYRETLKGRPSSMKGKKHTEETKRKISESSKKIKHTPEWNKRVSNALKGRRVGFALHPQKWSKKMKKIASERKKKFYEDPVQRQKISGKNNSNWRGGLSFEPYSVDWRKTLKRSIRERDKYTCQICGKEPAMNI